ncbi:hypothetical protein NP568_24530, partial [Vibrio parahaemolyticus]|nr:hypothetical protein [Vibrio parahaemolyticus]
PIYVLEVKKKKHINNTYYDHGVKRGKKKQTQYSNVEKSRKTSKMHQKTDTITQQNKILLNSQCPKKIKNKHL